MSTPDTNGWMAIETAPKDGTRVQFLRNGSEFTGTWQPYWCGSDCPCDVAGEGDEPFNSSPECWCAYRDGETIGQDVNPRHWRPLPSPPIPTTNTQEASP